jgi:hypothetical protein
VTGGGSYATDERRKAYLARKARHNADYPKREGDKRTAEWIRLNPWLASVPTIEEVFKELPEWEWPVATPKL